MTAPTDPPLTAVIIAYRKNQMNHRLIFGDPTLKIRRGWRRELAAFPEDCIFAYERWTANQYGTQDWRLFICRTKNDGDISKIPGIVPGAEILMNASGKTQVNRALKAIDMLRSECSALTTIPPHHWRAIHNAIQTRTGFLMSCEEEK